MIWYEKTYETPASKNNVANKVLALALRETSLI